MLLIKLSEFIEQLVSDKLYGNSIYACAMLEHELSKWELNAHFTKGLSKYKVEGGRRTIIFFSNDPGYIKYKDNIDALLSKGDFESEKEAFLLTSEQKQKKNDTENLVHFWLFKGLQNFNSHGEEQKIYGREYLNKWRGIDLYLESESLEYFFLKNKYPLPDTTFNGKSPSSTEFLNSLTAGAWKQEFSIELMKNFAEENLPEDFIEKNGPEQEYYFYRDGTQWHLAFDKERGSFRDSHGLREIYHLLWLFMEAKKNQKFCDPILAKDLELEAINQYEVKRGPEAILPGHEIGKIKKKSVDLDKKIEKAKADGKRSLMNKYQKEKEDNIEYKNKNTRPGDKEKNESPELRARKRVSTSINRAINRLSKDSQQIKDLENQCPLLQKHLKFSINGKDGFVYNPDPKAWVDWNLKSRTE